MWHKSHAHTDFLRPSLRHCQACHFPFKQSSIKACPGAVASANWGRWAFIQLPTSRNCISPPTISVLDLHLCQRLNPLGVMGHSLTPCFPFAPPDGRPKTFTLVGSHVNTPAALQLFQHQLNIGDHLTIRPDADDLVLRENHAPLRVHSLQHHLCHGRPEKHSCIQNVLRDSYTCVQFRWKSNGRPTPCLFRQRHLPVNLQQMQRKNVCTPLNRDTMASRYGIGHSTSSPCACRSTIFD